MVDVRTWLSNIPKGFNELYLGETMLFNDFVLRDQYYRAPAISSVFSENLYELLNPTDRNCIDTSQRQFVGLHLVSVGSLHLLVDEVKFKLMINSPINWPTYFIFEYIGVINMFLT